MSESGSSAPPDIERGARFPDLDLPDHTGRGPAIRARRRGPGAFAHVCALTDPGAALPYDTPEVQRARRDALAWWIPLLGDDFVCLTTLAVDAVRCAGAITVARAPRNFSSDPFARLFPGTVVEADLFVDVPPPPGPAIERYAGAPWPGGGF
jgi:hypothetical protein